MLLPVWASEPPSLFSGLGVAVGGVHDGVAAGVIAGVVSAGEQGPAEWSAGRTRAESRPAGC
ncbi:hypothetical protein [Streptomyces sp. OV198]|uniref:hypothetical protein n=1 Tax=Streptomyces sp. OV198 TaxID=1882787 RepID=UPI00211C396C|nr:hypothetical protein [Streptomyces sp. OV198]